LIFISPVIITSSCGYIFYSEMAVRTAVFVYLSMRQVVTDENWLYIFYVNYLLSVVQQITSLAVDQVFVIVHWSLMSLNAALHVGVSDRVLMFVFNAVKWSCPLFVVADYSSEY